MTQLLWFLAWAPFVFFAGLVIGALLPNHVRRLLAEGRKLMPKGHHRARFGAFLDQPPQRFITVLLLVVTLVACAGFLYTVREQNLREAGDARAERADERADARDRYIIDCISALLDDSAQASQARTKSTQKRDRAMLDVIEALVYGESAVEDFQRLNRTTKKLEGVRRGQPIPTFTEYCETAVGKQPDRDPDPRPSPTPTVEDSTQGAPSKAKGERKGRRASSKDDPKPSDRSPSTPRPSPSPDRPPRDGLLPELPDIELPDIELPDIELDDLIRTSACIIH